MGQATGWTFLISGEFTDVSKTHIAGGKRVNFSYYKTFNNSECQISTHTLTLFTKGSLLYEDKQSLVNVKRVQKSLSWHLHPSREPCALSAGPLHSNNGKRATNGTVKYSASGSSSDSAPVDILHFLKYEPPEGRQEGDSSPRLLCGKVKEPPRSTKHVETRRRTYKEEREREAKKKSHC